VRNPPPRVGAGRHLLGDSHLERRAQQGERSGRPESDSGDLGAQVLPLYRGDRVAFEALLSD
jgi:hypothetical protein